MLASCASPPDFLGCIETDPTSGWCTYAISDEEFEVDDEHLIEGKNWQEFNQTTVRIPPESFAKIKAYILKQCKKSGSCRKDLGKWERKFEIMEKKMPQLQIVN